MSLAKSDPICSSTGWCGPGHVPHDEAHEGDQRVDYGHNRPLDSDIINTQKHLKNTEEKLGHQWKLPKPAGLAALGSDMRSDPPWNSHEGYETRDHQAGVNDLHKFLNGLNIEYPEPHLS